MFGSLTPSVWATDSGTTESPSAQPLTEDPRVRDLPIPAYMQSTGYVGDVSFAIFALASELSTDEKTTSTRVTKVGATQLKTYRVPRTNEVTPQRMFSHQIAQAGGVSYGATDVRESIKVLPGDTLGELHVPCFLPTTRQRGNADALHPYGHVPVTTTSSNM